MATSSYTKKVTGVVADLSSSGFTKYTWIESGTVGANIFDVASDTTNAILKLTGTSGDVVNINGYSGDYTAKLSGANLTLENNDQIIVTTLAKNSVVTLKFLDTSKEVNLSAKTLGSQSLVTKGSVLHIDGTNSHELTSVTTAVKSALTDKTVTPNVTYKTINEAILSNDAVVTSKALIDKSGKSYATVDLAITSNDADIKKAALTDTTVTPNVTYTDVNAAIVSNDNSVISQALTGTGFNSMAGLIAAYNKLASQSLTSFKVEALTPATMLPGSAVTVSEGTTASFKITLNNRGTGDYSVKTMLTGTNATPDSDFVNSLTLDSASIAAGIKFNAATGILTIPATSPSVSATLSTSIKNDTVSPEAGEKVNLVISDAQGLNIAPLSNNDIASVTITDVAPAVFSVTPNAGPVLEGATTSFTVKLDNHALADYSVNVQLSGNNASTLTLDPTTPATIKFVNGILTIPAAATTTSVKFNTTIGTDNIDETNIKQSVTLALSQDVNNAANVNALISTTAGSTTTVVTDVAPPSFSVTPSTTSIKEGETATFNIALTNALAGSDYKVNLAATLDSNVLNTLALDAANSNTGITFDSGLLTIPASTITTATTAKLPIKAVFTTSTLPDNITSTKVLSLALSNPIGANVVVAPTAATINVNNVPAVQLTKNGDNFNKDNGLPSNTNTLVISDLLTLNNGDSILDDNTTDSDILNIITGALTIISTGTPINTPTIDKIETINLKALDAVSIDMSKITGVKTFNVKDSTAPVILTAIPDAATILGVSGSQVNNLNATYKTLTGKTDSLVINLDNATNAVVTVGTGFEFATLNVLGTNSLTSLNVNVSTLTISGTGALTIGNTTSTTGLIGVTDIELNNPNAIKFGNLAPITVFKSPNNTGGVTTGLIQGATGGFTMQLGSGIDSISVQDNASSSSINDIRLGSGDDILNFIKSANGNTYISGDDGNDTITLTGNNSTATSTISGGNGDDKITISVTGSYVISGGAGSDSINDGAGSNVIDGGADADTITGGGGNDTIIGGTGNDTFYVDSGTDTITDFTIGSDKLNISSGATAYVYASGIANYSSDVTNSGTGKLYIDGSQNYAGIPVTSAENITGSSGADSIIGGSGNDTITGGLGSDTITAVAGTDTITDFSISDTLIVSSGAIAYVYTSGTTDFSTVTNSGKLYIDGSKNYLGVNVTAAENITGSSGADSIIGGSGNDTITGGLGSDTITAVAGTDTITDFSISDTLIVSSGAIAYVYTSGTTDFSTVTNSGKLYIDGSKNYLGVNVTAAENITGSSGADSIIGGSGNDSIDGGAGNDTITGGLGSDTITASIGTDTITDFTIGEDTLIIAAGAIAHVYTLGSNNYVPVTNNGILYIDGIVAGSTQSITGSEGADSIVGGGYNDTIAGGNGNDTILGGYGDDSITGGLGNDIISGGSGRNTITVDSGTDTITDFLLSYDTLSISSGAVAHLYAFPNTLGGTVTYTAITNAGVLYIDGSTTYAGTQITGAESITGSTGADSIVGGLGNDTIYGGSGSDTITGGTGNDIINVDSNSTDIITDFNPSLDTLTIISGATAHVYASGTVNYSTAVTNSGTLYIDGATNYTGTAITGSNGSDSIVGGLGADTITAGTGVDTLTGGAGADMFIFGSDGSFISALDNITDFTSGIDVIRFAGSLVLGTGSNNGVSVDAYGFASFNSASNYSSKVNALQNANNTKAAQTISIFVQDSDTYVFFAGASTATTDDQIIKLTGVSGRFFDAITLINSTDITIS